MLTDAQIDAYFKANRVRRSRDQFKTRLTSLFLAHQCISRLKPSRLGEAVNRGSKQNSSSRRSSNASSGLLLRTQQIVPKNCSLPLGFEVRPALSRAVRGRGGRMPINHRGIIAYADEGACSVDVGFGGPMPARSSAFKPRR